MIFREKFYELLKVWLTQKGVENVKEVTSFDDSYYEPTRGGCPSCSYGEYNVEIWYSTSKRKGNIYTYNGHFSEVLEELLDIEI